MTHSPLLESNGDAVVRADDGAFGKACTVLLTEDHFVVNGTATRLSDVVGARVDIDKKGEKSALRVYAYSKGSKSFCRMSRERRPKHLSIQLDAEPARAEQWAAAINDKIGCSSSRKLLVIVNPVSGTGKGRRVWARTLEPMLDQAKVTYTVHFTTAAGQARRLLAEKSATEGAEPLSSFDGVIVVGGDGTLYEILQGIHDREDSQEQLLRLSLGTVPAGTGNGLAKTLLVESGEACTALSASFLVAKGVARKLDLCKAENVTGSFLSMLHVEYAIVSDVDFESETYRWMGAARFTLCALIRIIFMRSYPAKLSYQPFVDKSQSADLPPLADAIPDAWEAVEGDLVLLAIAQNAWIAEDINLSPASELDDGVLYIYFIRKPVSPCALLKLFLKLENGKHVDHHALECRKARAFRLTPLGEKGMIGVDGERTDYSTIQGEDLSALFR
ncbi:unnamed protein product, partial [Chrysoparadoxa australica]